MKTFSFVACLVVLVVGLASTSAFAPRPSVATRAQTAVPLNMGFMGGDEDRQRITRDTEPEDYFRTNTDKMTDEEKLPIAIAGLVFISLPFIAGLIALYSAK